ncbi:hypothetical protein DOM21_02365 [Bacteriovorax stolpii]|uniref:Uncharacterized protein n=1 Tax=Bacteriovorax stolpii TaxID=960 RepID=A0A2K9NW05_BACTC|nr:hypothetical protein [Bacteriovorax stolpii]AUN99687.1 hypothetical protein C0V70_16545 [Bacteriovorax stolpii]QDK40315.1 hypothetical protein DOM21_02365 [Bacteriovorax stolpii]TDP51319.1 hypothetical protein C8D79_3491 [Bacteriovorax stolpii]
MAAQYISLGILLIFSILSFVDGVYIHLLHYRLQEQTASKYEHYLHSLRALLFFLILLFIYYFRSSGIWLWIGCFFILFDYIIESIDMFAEKESRQELGGLPSFEYWLHGTLVMLRSLSLGLWFSSISLSRFNLNDSAMKAHLTGLSSLLIEQILISTLCVVGLHILLIFRPNALRAIQWQCCKNEVMK